MKAFHFELNHTDKHQKVTHWKQPWFQLYNAIRLLLQKKETVIKQE